MIIREFKECDIKAASKLSQLTWGDFYTHESFELQNLIYNFMVEYYDLNRKYSFSCIVGDELKGFLLAFKKNNKYTSANFKNNVQILKNKDEQKVAFDLFHYLETCGQELKNIMNNNDIILGLFVSIQKGCGKALLSHLNKTCIENGIKNIYLWTDTTCDYQYYKKNKFILLKEIETYVNSKTIKTLIYRKKVE